MYEMKPEYYIGIDMIDEEHKQLFKYADEAYELLHDEFTPDKYDKMDIILEKLRDELNLSEKLFCNLKKHCKQNGFLAVYAETNEESLIIFYRPQSNQRVFGIRRNFYSKNGNSIEIGLLINENTFLWFKTAAIVSYKNNNLKSIFNDVIQEINKITIDEKALPQDKFRSPYVACLEYLSKYGYSIKTIEWE